jgi:UDP-GlcNAc:undecaprenyl-phosphate GlcNAc-1-phosphate transferase
MVATRLACESDPNGMRALCFGALYLGAVGVLDDRFALSAGIRLAAQIVAALLMVYGGGICLENLGHFAPGQLLALGDWAVPVTVFATVGVINALNMADGLDGLAGTLSLIPVLAMAALASMTGLAAETETLIMLAASMMAFLCLNLRRPRRKRASVFMGDAGSTFLGFAVAWFCIDLSQGAEPALAPVTALWLCALPVCDTVRLMVRRIRDGRSPFAADREHLHHVLQRAGYTVNQTVFAMGGLAAALAGIGVGAQALGVPDWVMLYAFLLLSGLHYWGVPRLWSLAERPPMEHEEGGLSYTEPAPADGV